MGLKGKTNLTHIGIKSQEIVDFEMKGRTINKKLTPSQLKMFQAGTDQRWLPGGSRHILEKECLIAVLAQGVGYHWPGRFDLNSPARRSEET